MDNELRECLEAMEARLTARIDVLQDTLTNRLRRLDAGIAGIAADLALRLPILGDR